MRRHARGWLVAAALVQWAARSAAQGQRTVSFTQAFELARAAAPDVRVARARETLARSEVGVAGVYPNPTVIVGTSTQAARASFGVAVPLVVFGQRGAAIDASRAELATARIDSQVTWNDVRAAVAHAFITLWASQRIASERAENARVARTLDDAVRARVDVGAAPEIDALRVRAERLRADADAQEAEQMIGVAASELGRWLGATGDAGVRAQGDPVVPNAPPPFADLAAHIGANPAIRRENADTLAARARVTRERALVRPVPVVEVGVDVGDPTLPAPNYRAQLAFDVPVFNQRGPYIEREQAAAAAAAARSSAARARILASLEGGYRAFVASSARTSALADGVVAATELASRMTRESYALGRAQLVAVLEAEKARIDARSSLVDAMAARANAWVDIEYAVGQL